MKFANGNERLEMHILKGEKKNIERANGQSVSLPIIHYDHEPRSLLVFSERPFLTWIELIQSWSENIYSKLMNFHQISRHYAGIAWLLNFNIWLSFSIYFCPDQVFYYPQVLRHIFFQKSIIRRDGIHPPSTTTTITQLRNGYFSSCYLWLFCLRFVKFSGIVHFSVLNALHVLLSFSSLNEILLGFIYASSIKLYEGQSIQPPLHTNPNIIMHVSFPNLLMQMTNNEFI